MINIRKHGFAGLLGLVVAGAALSGCSKENPVPKIDPNAPIVKIETKTGYEEAKVIGKSYYPQLHISQKVKVSYGTAFLDDNAHSHQIPIEITEPEKYFLILEIHGRTFVKKVNEELFRDAPNNGVIMTRYNEKREVSYRPNVAESEKLSDEFSDLEILSLELKKE